MKEILLINILLFFSATSFAGPKTIYGEQGLKSVETSLDWQVNELSNGVCSILRSNGRGCCTGFFIASDMVMTNYHCLECVYKKEETNLETSAVFPLAFSALPKRTSRPLTKIEAINSRADLLSKVKFQYKPFPLAYGYQEEKIKISKIVAANKSLDFLVLQLSRPVEKARVNVLSDASINPSQRLVTIGYPSRSPFPGQKVYDKTGECAVSDPLIPFAGGRRNNFGHQCDTNPGSSGSPIFERFSGSVIGLHWSGGAMQKPQPDQKNKLGEAYLSSENRAIRMEAILEDLKEQHLEIFRKLQLE